MSLQVNHRNPKEGKDMIALGVVVIVLGIALAIIGAVQSAKADFNSFSPLIYVAAAAVLFGLLLWGIGSWRHWRAN